MPVVSTYTDRDTSQVQGSVSPGQHMISMQDKGQQEQS